MLIPYMCFSSIRQELGDMVSIANTRRPILLTLNLASLDVVGDFLRAPAINLATY